jgi:hypothetical protein
LQVYGFKIQKLTLLTVRAGNASKYQYKKREDERMYHVSIQAQIHSGSLPSEYGNFSF